MEYISNTLGNLVDQTAFMNLTFGNPVSYTHLTLPTKA